MANKRRAVALAGSCLLLAAAGPSVYAQAPRWSVEGGFSYFSVSDAHDWLELHQRVARRWQRGDRLLAAIIETRRFGRWDQSFELRGTLHPTPELWLTARGLITLEPEVRESRLLGFELARSTNALTAALGYEYRLYREGAVHQLGPRFALEGGRFRLGVRAWITRTPPGTTNGAGLLRAGFRPSAAWEAWVGAAGGEEDFIAGPPESPTLQTLRTRSLFLGGEWSPTHAWSIRLDLIGVHSEPRLDRIGIAVGIIHALAPAGG